MTKKVPCPPQPPEAHIHRQCTSDESQDQSSIDDDNKNCVNSDAVTEHSVFKRPLALEETTLDNELVVSDLLTNRSFRLNQAGVDIWRGLGAQQPLVTVATNLAINFNLERNEALTIVRLYAEKLLHSVLLSKLEGE